MKNLIIEELNNILENNIISFHMPGHKSGKIYVKLGYEDMLKKIYKMDITEIPGTDNLHSPEGVIKRSQERASQIFKSDNTIFLVNGSTCGIQAAIMSTCRPGSKIILNRDCHQSVINSCILGDIEPIYIPSKICKETNMLCGVDAKDVKDIIDDNLDATSIILTYPTYYGKVYDLEKICEYAHSKGLVVIIDEAHGAHLDLSEKLPKSALTCGADIVIQSTHKTLPAFTQSSMIHTQGERIDVNRLMSLLRIIESSSPSYVLLSSLEIATDIYVNYGYKLMDELIVNINEFKVNIRENDGLDVYDSDDLTKVFISYKNIGLTGYELEDMLRTQYNIQVELSNYYGILLICTIGNEKIDFIELEEALKDIRIKNKKGNVRIEEINYPISTPEKVFTPREAFYKTKNRVKINDSIGKICGEYIIPYPPGVSLLSPGEKITKEVIDYILLCNNKGMNVSGIKDQNLEYIEVIL